MDVSSIYVDGDFVPRGDEHVIVGLPRGKVDVLARFAATRDQCWVDVLRDLLEAAIDQLRDRPVPVVSPLRHYQEEGLRTDCPKPF